MKTLIFFCTLILSTLTTFSQTIEGTYANKWLSKTGEGIEYILTLQDNGEFTFNHRRMFKEASYNTDVEVQGTWELKGHLLVLNTNNSLEQHNDIAAKLDSNKARFISVSRRNPDFNMVKPKLQFYKSDVFYANDMELVKTESSVTTAEL